MHVVNDVKMNKVHTTFRNKFSDLNAFKVKEIDDDCKRPIKDILIISLLLNGFKAGIDPTFIFLVVYKMFRNIVLKFLKM